MTNKLRCLASRKRKCRISFPISVTGAKRNLDSRFELHHFFLPFPLFSFLLFFSFFEDTDSFVACDKNQHIFPNYAPPLRVICMVLFRQRNGKSFFFKRCLCSSCATNHRGLFTEIGVKEERLLTRVGSGRGAKMEKEKRQYYRVRVCWLCILRLWVLTL